MGRSTQCSVPPRPQTKTKTLFEHAKAWKDELPVLVRLSTDAAMAAGVDVFVWAWLGRLVGAGKICFLTPVDVSSGDGLAYAAEVVSEDVGGRPLAKSKTSHSVFVDILKRWQQQQGPAAHYHVLEQLLVQRWRFGRDAASTKFRVILEGEHSSRHLSCVEKLACEKKLRRLRLACSN